MARPETRPSRQRHRSPPRTPRLRVGVRPCPPARLGQPRRLHSLHLRLATPCGGPEAPGSPGPGRMEADASQELVRSYLTMAALGTERGPPSSGAPRKEDGRLRAPTGDAPPTPPLRGARGFYLATCWWEVISPELGNPRAAEPGRSPKSSVLPLFPSLRPSLGRLVLY